VPASLVRDLQGLGVAVQNAFGMTENCSFQYTRPDDSIEVVANTCGRPCEGFELALWREDNPDELALPGESGEMGVRGACLMLGYFDDQASTEAAFNRRGWFMTGDLGRLDASGNLQVIGRKKDIIIRGGHNIYPTRIEGLVLRHHAVLKAAVFPVPDNRLGECACLSVILREKGALAAADLLRFLAEQGLSKYDMPEYYCELNQFPLTPSGKVLKREMVAMVGRGEIIPEFLRQDKRVG
jgi:acyl-CoA synthetase